jgi:hypothetical protein
MLHRITDPDGNTVERGMACVFEGRIYVVGYAIKSKTERTPLVCLDGCGESGRPERVLLSGFYLRRIHLLGYQLPLVF